MTLQRYLTGLADRRWLSGHALLPNRPRPDHSLPPVAILIQALPPLLLALAIGAILAAAISGTAMRGAWPLHGALLMGLSVGIIQSALLTLAWNRRAAQLRNAQLTTPAEPAPRRAWQTWLVAPFYTLVLLLITPLFLAVAIDNVLGTLAWNRARAGLVARSEPLSFAQLLPPRPPDDQNFALSPLLRPLVEYEWVVTNNRTALVWKDPAGRNRLRAIGLPNPIQPANYNRRTATNDGRYPLDTYARGIRAHPIRRIDFDLPPDLATRYGVSRTGPREPVAIDPAMAARYGLAVPPPTPAATPPVDLDAIRAAVIADPAAEVLAYLQRFEPELAEIAEASRRPASYGWISAGPDLDISPPLSHFAIAKTLSTLFRTRAAARLVAGDQDGAHHDTLVLLRLATISVPDPVLIAHLVRIAQTAIAFSAVAEGLGARAWSDPQLAELQDLIARFDFQTEAVRAMRGERVFGHSMFEGMIRGVLPNQHLLEHSEDAAPHGTPFQRIPGLTPYGLLRRSQVLQHRLYDTLIARLEAPDWAAAMTRSDYESSLYTDAGLEPMRPSVILPRMLTAAIATAGTKAARQEVTARLARVACALERHRLRHGSFPGRLDQLVPAFLPSVPLDPMDGQPLRYRPLDNGWFQLWSVALNGRDDGGVMSTPGSDAEGDWVWPIPIPSVGPRLVLGPPPL
ncbi:MAG: hypothetical protein KF833_14540 [Verrucomicrobiae bacterium]|nr:hypothetical protein [Verrucomicrobiae bacterium]